jgi:hypothetical protein
MLFKYLPDIGAFDTIAQKRLSRKNIFWEKPKKQRPRPKLKPKAMGAGFWAFLCSGRFFMWLNDKFSKFLTKTSGKIVKYSWIMSRGFPSG